LILIFSGQKTLNKVAILLNLMRIYADSAFRRSVLTSNPPLIGCELLPSTVGAFC